MTAEILAPLIQRVRTDITAVKRPDGVQAWTKQALTPERLARHLNGGPARGVCPIKEGESVTMVALLDFDSHKGEIGWPAMSAAVRNVADMLELAHGAAPVLFRSSGGLGVHLYVIWDAPQDARSVRLWLAEVLRSCGLSSGTGGLVKSQVEIFPKQDSVPKGGNGNQFILPLAGKSRPLAWDELAGVFVDTDPQGLDWPASTPVRLAPPEAQRERPAVDLSTGESLWRSALDGLKNGLGGAPSLDYDAWRNVIFGIHHETNGSDEGLALAHEWSKRSPKYDPDFLESRVWPYVRSERGGAVVTGRTIMSIAGKEGWHEPLDDSAFAVVPDHDDDPFDHGGAGGSRGVDLSTDAEQSAAVGAMVGADGVPRVAHGAVPVVGARGVGRVHEEISDGAEHGDDDDLTGLGDAGAGSGAGDSAGAAPVARPAATAPTKRGTIPEAKHLCTDQANANRIVRGYGKRVLVSAGRWYVYDGQRWKADEADVYRYACQLSKLIGKEAEEWEKKAERLLYEAKALVEATGGKADTKSEIKAQMPDAKLAEADTAIATAEALRKWAIKSEMKATIESAVGLARKMLTVDTELLDADPMAFNMANGTLDLATGKLRPHRAGDMISKLAPVMYYGCDIKAQGRWPLIVAQITGEDHLPEGQRPVAQFLQRWAGYCATGSTREQVFVVHNGDGHNGKSLVILAMALVLGDYADTAAPGLLAGSGRDSDRHPTEIAALKGKRCVTAHETAEGAVLREDFVKQATGGDALTGRFMREDFFTFKPTHKLQLLTNHKPAIKGQDAGIWRRVVLLPYSQSFGTPEQVASGERLRVADMTLAEVLGKDPAFQAEVAAWVAAGAMEWAANGLNPPDSIRAASSGYKTEQDRVGQFIKECCETAPADVISEIKQGHLGADGVRAWSEPLTQGMNGVYPGYVAWCREGGHHGLARGRFVDGLHRAVPGLMVKEHTETGESGKRRKILRVYGLRLLPE